MNEVRLTLGDLADLSGLEPKARMKALEILREGASRIYDDAYALCPVRTGALRNTLRIEDTGKGVAIAAGGGLVTYAAIVNERVPFLDLAFWSNAPSIESRLKHEVGDVLTE